MNRLPSRVRTQDRLVSLLAREWGALELAAIWAVSLGVTVTLGLLRISTDAEFSFASAVTLPVLLVSWCGGRSGSLLFAVLASVMWVASDLLVGRQYSASWVPFANGLTRLAVYALIAYLVSLLKTLLTRERLAAMHDPLTGLLNRRALFALGEAETERARRYGHPVGIVFLDLDNFKRLNDERGHDAGDRALKEVAHALKDSLRKIDFAVRFGGDEFVVLLPETPPQAAARAAEKLGAALKRALQDLAPVSASIGVACFAQVPGSFDEMLKAADSLMYEIKQRGKSDCLVREFHGQATGGPGQ